MYRRIDATALVLYGLLQSKSDERDAKQLAKRTARGKFLLGAEALLAKVLPTELPG